MKNKLIIFSWILPFVGVLFYIISSYIGKVMRMGESLAVKGPATSGEILFGLFSSSLLFLITLTSLVFGIIGLINIKQTNFNSTKKGHAIFSIILNILVFLITTFAISLFFSTITGMAFGVLAIAFIIYSSIKIYKNPEIAWKSYAISGIILNSILSLLGVVLILSVLIGG